MTDYDLHILPNNIRVIHKQVTNTKIVHCGFMLDIGSRDESADEQGLAHFWEHMAFKGTTRRNSFHILNRMESVGGELNAYTTKEKVAFYASVLDVHFQKAVELLTDITFNSIFPERQIQREKNVILEEMSMYYDSPEDAIQDDFDELVFKNHPLGANILGTKETVGRFDREDFLSFIRNHLDTGKIILSVVGNLPFKKVVRMAEKYLSDIPKSTSGGLRIPFEAYSPTTQTVSRPITQAHCAIGREAYSLSHPNRLKFFTLMNILGGPGMNSRLNMALREKHGYVYSVDASYHGYTDTGMFAIFFATDKNQLERSIKLVHRELKKLRETPLGKVQLHTAKQQLKGQLAMAEENNAHLMLMLAKSILDLEKVEPLEEIFNEIKSTTSLELCDIANELFQEDSLSRLIFLPE
jgi:predicted Zn-dependent peptidase